MLFDRVVLTKAIYNPSRTSLHKAEFTDGTEPFPLTSKDFVIEKVDGDLHITSLETLVTVVVPWSSVLFVLPKPTAAKPKKAGK